jgi:hypothetical protein
MGLEALAEAIDGLDGSCDAASVKRLLWLRDRLEAKVIDVVIGFDRDCGWAFEGAGSLQAWLRTEAGCSDRDANRITDTARKLAQLLEVHGAWRRGEVTGGQVDLVMYAASSKRLPVLVQIDAAIAENLAGASIVETKRMMSRLAAMVDDIVDDGSEGGGAEQRANRLHLSQTLDGRWKLTGDLSAECGEMFDAALRLAATNDPECQQPPSERLGDAVGTLSGFVLDNHRRDDVAAPRPGQRRNRPHLHVVINPDGSAETDNGIRVPGGTVERLLCDAKVNTVAFADGHVLYYGRALRTASDAQFQALVVRDRHCRFPGCERRASWCSAHHVEFWEHGGLTDIDNLVLLCGEHHRRLHDQPGWRNKLLPDGTYEVTWPSGVTRCTRPPGIPGEGLF